MHNLSDTHRNTFITLHPLLLSLETDAPSAPLQCKLCCGALNTHHFTAWLKFEQWQKVDKNYQESQFLCNYTVHFKWNIYFLFESVILKYFINPVTIEWSALLVELYNNMADTRHVILCVFQHHIMIFSVFGITEREQIFLFSRI